MFRRAALAALTPPESHPYELEHLLGSADAAVRACQRSGARGEPGSDARGENILDSGAPWYDTYETSDGRDNFLNWTATVNLKKDHVLYIPFGCVAHFVHADDLSDGEQRSNIGIDATCLAAPLFNKGWKDKLLPNIVEAIKALNEPHFTAKAGSPMWSQRAESFRAFM